MTKILIADREPSVRELILAELNDMGFEVVGIENWEDDIIKLIEEEKPDLIIIDIWPEKEKGRKISREIKKKFPNTPIIFYMCCYEDGDRSADFVLMKSYDLGKLKTLIAELIGNKGR